MPFSGAAAGPGDGEGQNEMNLSMGYLKDYLTAWRAEADGVRIFFPDNVVSLRLEEWVAVVERLGAAAEVQQQYNSSESAAGQQQYRSNTAATH
jgi:hypothetical protein